MSSATSDTTRDQIGRVIELAKRRSPSAPRVVAIDGRAGSGKTTFARSLAEQLGQDSFTIHMDDIFPGWEGLAQAPNYLVEQVLEPLRRGVGAWFQPWDWHQSRRCGKTLVPRREWIIVEGVGSGSRMVREYLALLVWLEADEQTRKRRGLGRDGEMFEPHWHSWAKQETRLFEVEQTPAQADLSIRT